MTKLMKLLVLTGVVILGIGNAIAQPTARELADANHRFNRDCNANRCFDRVYAYTRSHDSSYLHQAAARILTLAGDPDLDSACTQDLIGISRRRDVPHFLDVECRFASDRERAARFEIASAARLHPHSAYVVPTVGDIDAAREALFVVTSYPSGTPAADLVVARAHAANRDAAHTVLDRIFATDRDLSDIRTRFRSHQNLDRHVRPCDLSFVLAFASEQTDGSSLIRQTRAFARRDLTETALRGHVSDSDAIRFYDTLRSVARSIPPNPVVPLADIGHARNFSIVTAPIYISHDASADDATIITRAGADGVGADFDQAPDRCTFARALDADNLARSSQRLAISASSSQAHTRLATQQRAIADQALIDAANAAYDTASRCRNPLARALVSFRSHVVTRFLNDRS
jgi:hypothetical protein